MEDLIQGGVPVEVVPGITAGVAAPAYGGIPVTHRDYSSSVTFVTGHEAVGKYRSQVNWSAIAQGSDTIVIYMSIHNFSQIVERLQAGGFSSDTPIALIRWGTQPEQTELIGTLETIVEQIQKTQIGAPAIALIGQIVNLHSRLSHSRPSCL